MEFIIAILIGIVAATGGLAPNKQDPEEIAKSGLKTIQCIGDCLAPGIIAAAVHSGHLAAREFEADAPGEVPFLRERVML